MKLAKTSFDVEIILNDKNVKELVFDDIDSFKQTINNFSGKFELVIRRRTRSLKQNAYHWKLMSILAKEISEATGNDYDSNYFHELCKLRFLSQITVIDFVTQETIQIYPDTKQLDRKAFDEFQKKYKLFFLEQYQIDLPDPKTAKETDYL